jgi:hypothetical protein
MNIEIPNFLLKMSKEINSQDNCMTSEPIITVCHDERLTTAEGYQEEGSEWCGEDGFICNGPETEELLKHIVDEFGPWFDQFCIDREINQDDEDSFDQAMDYFDPEYDDLPDDISKWFYQNTRKTVKYCLTRSDAEAFIARHQHNYPKLYTYVESMHSCPEMIELRNWIMSLSKSDLL